MAVDVNSPIGGTLRNLRHDAGISQQRLAQLADCSLSMVKLLERGYEPDAKSEVLARVVAALKDEALANEKAPAATGASSNPQKESLNDNDR